MAGRVEGKFVLMGLLHLTGKFSQAPLSAKAPDSGNNPATSLILPFATSTSLSNRVPRSPYAVELEGMLLNKA